MPLSRKCAMTAFLAIALLPRIGTALENDPCDDDFDACQLRCWQKHEELTDPEQGGNPGASGVGLWLCSAVCWAIWAGCEIGAWLDDLGWFGAFDIADDPGSGIQTLDTGVTAIPPELQTITLRAGRSDGSAFLPSAGSVTEVRFHAAPMALLASDASPSSAIFSLIGSGTFNSSTGLWELDWTIPDPAIPGYLLAAEFLDPTIGPVPGANDGISLGQIVARHVLITAQTEAPVPAFPTWGRIALVACLALVAALAMLRRRSPRLAA